MIEIKHSKQLVGSPIYDYYQNLLQQKINFYLGLGHSRQLSEAMQHHEEDQSGIIWAEHNSKPCGFISYSRQKVIKQVMILSLMQADNEEVFTKMYEFFEDFSKSLGCIYIHETVTMKDTTRIDELENIGFNKEFYIMFKNV